MGSKGNQECLVTQSKEVQIAVMLLFLFCFNQLDHGRLQWSFKKVVQARNGGKLVTGSWVMGYLPLLIGNDHCRPRTPYKS